MRTLHRSALAALSALLFLGLLASTAEAQRVSRAAAKDKKAIVFVGMPGSGKSFVSHRVADRAGAPKPLVSGDVIREAIGKTRTKKEQAERSLVVSREFAAKQGEVGRRVAKKAAAQKGDLVIVEGFRTAADLSAFREAHPDTTVVAIDVPTGVRHSRMLKRGRAGEDNKSYLRKRDREERKLGLGELMKTADLVLRVRSNDPAEIDAQIDKVLERAGAGQGPRRQSPRRQATGR
jgi:dephospho-CoA kinase